MDVIFKSGKGVKTDCEESNVSHVLNFKTQNRSQKGVGQKKYFEKYYSLTARS